MLARVTLAVCAAAVLGAPAHAQNSVEAFYKGRTVELVVGTLPGGGYDLYGRLVARYLGRHIPGRPTGGSQRCRSRMHRRLLARCYSSGRGW